MTVTELWRFPVPPTALLNDPNFAVLPRRRCELSFSIERDDGGWKLLGLVFEGVEAFQCTCYVAALSLDQIKAYGRLVDVGASGWLSQIQQRLAEYSVKAKLPAPTLKHMAICFDDGPCYEFICTGFAVTP